MNITVLQGEIQKQVADVLIVNLFFGASPGGASGAVDKALGGQIAAAIELGDFSGSAGETLLLYGGDKITAPRVLVVGLGDEDNFNVEGARSAAGTAIGALNHLGARNAATILHGTGAGNLLVEAAAQPAAIQPAAARFAFETRRLREEAPSMYHVLFPKMQSARREESGRAARSERRRRRTSPPPPPSRARASPSTRSSTHDRIHVTRNTHARSTHI